MTRKEVKLCSAGLVLVLVGAVVAGCASVSQATPSAVNKSASSAYASKTLTTSYAGALDASSQLMLGMLKLDGTDKPVTAEQAKSMLTALQALQGQVFKADAERNAVWANVEKQLTPAQLSAIAEMHLTQADVQTWIQTNNQSGAGPQGMPGGAGPQGTPPAGMGQSGPRPQGTPPAGMGQGGARPQGTPGARQGGTGAQGGVGALPGMGAGGSATSGPSSILLPALVRLLMLKTGGDQAPPGPMATPAKP